MRRSLEGGEKCLEQGPGEPKRARSRGGSDQHREGSEPETKGSGHAQNSGFRETDRSSFVHRLLNDE